MATLFNFLRDWTQPIIGGKKFTDWKKQDLNLQKVKLKNKKLSKELEMACQKDGFLTYAEYLQIEQFGEHGYHAHHKDHGFTPTYKIWSQAIFSVLQKNSIHTVIDVGPGNKYLAESLFKLSQKNNFSIQWNGVEIEESFRESIKNAFKDKKFNSFFGRIEKSIDKLPYYNNAFVIFSYALDSIPPEILVHTRQEIGYPDTMLGIKVENGILTEFILDEEDLKKKDIAIKNGIITFRNTVFDLSSWKLAPMQRGYVTLQSFSDICKIFQKVKNPSLLIMDEVRTSPEVLRSEHILSPLYLNIKNRYSFSPSKAYERAGELLFYYPLFLTSILSFLEDSGFQNIQFGPEEKVSSEILGKNWTPDKKFRYFLCYGFLGQRKIKPKKIIRLLFPQA